MKSTYNYDELYGTLLYQNKSDDIRKYFVLECEYYNFYKWMFMYGWNKARDHPCERNSHKGFEIILRR
jgi:hypothetical protein